MKADETVLASVFVCDPLHVFFDVDAPTLRRMGMTKAEERKDAKLPIAFGLANEEGYPHSGVAEFVGEPNQTTETIRLRAVVPNKERSLMPGTSVRVRLGQGALPRP